MSDMDGIDRLAQCPFCRSDNTNINKQGQQVSFYCYNCGNHLTYYIAPEPTVEFESELSVKVLQSQISKLKWLITRLISVGNGLVHQGNGAYTIHEKHFDDLVSEWQAMNGDKENAD